MKKMSVFQHRNNVSLSTLNQRQNLTLKQCGFWVDSKKLTFDNSTVFKNSYIKRYLF